MNHLEGHPSPRFDHNEYQTYGRLPQIISTIALLILGYYALSFLDAWPSTSKRRLYDLSVRLTPSQFIYAMQNIMMRLGRLSDQERLFCREDFGNHKAKEEALQRVIGSSPIPSVLQRARTFSGYDKILPTTKDTGPPGLGNWDNSCYQNSVLQGMASLPAFQAYVHRSLMLCEKTRVPSQTTGALAAFVDRLSDASCRKQTIWTPKVLKSMDSWQQQDAQEYFTRVLEAVEKEAIQYTKQFSKRTSVGLGCLRENKPASDAEKEKTARKMLESLVNNPMDGMFAQALTCQTCGFSEGVSLTQFNCLTVNLGLGGSRSIEGLLDEYTRPELIEGVECDNCTRIARKKGLPEGEELPDSNDEKAMKEKVKKELRVKAKQINFGRLPIDLVVHVNRSIWDDYGNQVKNPAFVHFPPRLDFSSKWCAQMEAKPESTQAMYELKCIVTHSGRHDNGHYVAYGKRDKDWYCFNDEIVTKVTEQQVLTRGNVFMLFYEAFDDFDTADEDDNFVQAQSESKEGIESMSVASSEPEIYEEPMDSSSQGGVSDAQAAHGERFLGSQHGTVLTTLPTI